MTPYVALDTRLVRRYGRDALHIDLHLDLYALSLSVGEGYATIDVDLKVIDEGSIRIVRQDDLTRVQHKQGSE